MRRLLYLLSLATALSGHAATYTVAPSGGDYTTFAALVAAHTLTSDDVVVFQAASAGGSATFDERIAPNGSGTSGHPIVIRKRYGDTCIIRGINGGTNNYITVLGLEITQPSSSYNYSAIVMGGCSNWLIEDNYIHDTYGGGIEFSFNTTNSNNIIRRNRYSNVGGTSLGAGSNAGITMQIYGHYNLVEYNTIDTSLDRVRPQGTGNVVRNNYYSGTDTTLYPSSSPYPFHTDGVQGVASASYPLIQLLYERNWDMDNRDSYSASHAIGPNGHGLLSQGGSGQGFGNYIMRFNAMIREAEAVSILNQVTTVRGYNNTFISIGVDRTTNFNNAITWDTATGNDDYDYRNNTFSYCPHMLDSGGLIAWNTKVTTKTSATNHSYNTGTQATLPTGASPANLAQTDPKFTDGTGVVGHDDYTLQSASPLKASGTGVTTAVGAGVASTSLAVADAYPIFDGWGIADADWIKIGSGAYVQVVSIDYSTKVVTLSAARTWSNGDSVLVKGNEDVGALPYSYTPAVSVPTVTNTTATASPTTLSATTTTVEAVRKVEFLFNGLPVLTVNYTGSSPLSGSYTPSGIGTLEARAYNYWASQTPTVSSYLLINQDPSGLSATAVSPAQINLAWTDNSAGADTFSIEQSPNGTTGWAEVATTGAGVVTRSITGLAAGTTYYYRVRAVNSGVYSGYSSNANATTLGSTPYAPTLRNPAALSAGI